MTLRALEEALREADVVGGRTQRTVKLLNHYAIKINW